MILYRIAKARHAEDLSGTGAALYGGRWNSKGIPVLYTGESKEITLLEVIANTPPMLIPDLEILELKIPANSLSKLTSKVLPDNWFDYPSPAILAELGDMWAKEGKTLALQVPSCIIHSAHNYILNCRHRLFPKVKIISKKPFHFDTRLARGLNM